MAGQRKARGCCLTAVDATHSRVIVHSDLDDGWIQSGTCQAPTGPPLFDLNEFYSLRSDTTIPVPVAKLRQRAHVVLLGAYVGDDPVACAVIK